MLAKIKAIEEEIARTQKCVMTCLFRFRLLT